MCFLSRARQRGLIKKNCATFRAERRKLENIGKLKAMVHPQAKSGVQRNQVFAITEHSALASINLASGEINWRNTVPAGESFDSLRLYGKHLLTLSVDQTHANKGGKGTPYRTSFNYSELY